MTTVRYRNTYKKNETSTKVTNRTFLRCTVGNNHRDCHPLALAGQNTASRENQHHWTCIVPTSEDLTSADFSPGQLVFKFVIMLGTCLLSGAFADMGALMLDRIWHAYPSVTVEGLAISSLVRMPLDTVAAEQRAWDVLRVNEELGFQVDCDFAVPHICAADFSCPLTWRSSQDEGCMTLRFGTLPASAIDTSHTWRDESLVGWSIGAMSSCSSYDLSVLRARSYLDTERQQWKTGLQSLCRRIRP
ncbi:hypothetical protein C8R43DRAFT_963527 [Mycena crocata]|nr:hypothetical protein C8R43DRAFT_964584 [Mycena crocata]KAJ7106092.1 hypothetical protein C8R43DRAFT_963527 [Mycena crocata]